MVASRTSRDSATASSPPRFKHVAELPLAARYGLTASFCAFDLLLTDMRENGAEVLELLDDGGLRNLPQFVEGGVRQVEPSGSGLPAGRRDNRRR